jgi:hypothetical protein
VLEREQVWALVSARGEGISIRKLATAAGQAADRYRGGRRVPEAAELITEFNSAVIDVTENPDRPGPLRHAQLRRRGSSKKPGGRPRCALAAAPC